MKRLSSILLTALICCSFNGHAANGRFDPPTCKSGRDSCFLYFNCNDQQGERKAWTAFSAFWAYNKDGQCDYPRTSACVYCCAEPFCEPCNINDPNSVATALCNVLTGRGF